ncbi:MAG: M20/M25/M40 family metallo-hydrolase [Bryobacteraceae bacterium]
MIAPRVRIVVLGLAGVLLVSGQNTVDREMTAKIRVEGLEHSQALPVFETLTIEIGPRLTNSPAFKRAIDFARDRLETYGLANVHLEPWKFGRGWTLEHLTVEMVEPRYMPLIGYAEGWSPSTPGDLVATPVFLGGKTPAEIESLRASIKGAIVMTQPIQTAFVRQDRPQPTEGSGDGPPVLSPPALFRGAPEAQRFTTLVREAGPGVMLRPNVLADGTVYVTGRDAGPSAVPSIVLASEHYNLIARMLEHKIPVKLRVNIQSKFYDTDLNAYNLIGEIPGTDPALKDQVVMLGAHIDSWHTGVGATDNADGTTTMMEAMRILKAVGARPRRTIRVAIWGGEEQGLLGSKAWVAQHLSGDANRQARDNLAVYFNIDNGTGPIYGFALENNADAKPILDSWLEPLKDLGVRRNVNLHLTDTDHLSFLAVGVPGFNPFQDYQDYDVRTHHTNMDMVEHVKPEDLRQAAIVMASFAYNAAMRDRPIPRPQTAH